MAMDTLRREMADTPPRGQVLRNIYEALSDGRTQIVTNSVSLSVCLSVGNYAEYVANVVYTVEAKYQPSTYIQTAQTREKKLYEDRPSLMLNMCN